MRKRVIPSLVAKKPISSVTARPTAPCRRLPDQVAHLWRCIIAKDVHQTVKDQAEVGAFHGA